MAATNQKKGSAKPDAKHNTKPRTKKSGSSNSKSSGRSKAAEAKKRAQTRAEWEKQRKRFIIAIILFIMAVFFTFMYFMPGEKLWLSLHELYCGIFGVFGFMFPLILIYSSYQNAKDEPKPNYKSKIIQLSLTTIFLASTVFCFNVGDDPLRGYADELHNSLIYSSTHTGPGVIGAMLGIPFYGHGATSVVCGIIILGAMWYVLFKVKKVSNLIFRFNFLILPNRFSKWVLRQKRLEEC